MVVVALPFFVAAEIVESRQQTKTVVSNSEPLRREEYRRDAAKTSALVGLGLTLTGAVVLASGLVLRRNLRGAQGTRAEPRR